MRFYNLFILGITASASASTIRPRDPCNSNSPPNIAWNAKGNAEQITATGRSYIVHIAPGYDHTVSRPVVISFHGSGVDAEFQQGFSNFSHPSHRIGGRDIITVYPQGLVGIRKPCTPEKPPKRAWQGAPMAAPGVDDISFTKNILDDIQDLFCVDKSRIYITGQSNGGAITNILACTPSINSRIAAFGTASAVVYPDLTPPCNPGRAVPFISTHGTNDTLVPIDGMPPHCGSPINSMLSVHTWRSSWAKNNGCMRWDISRPIISRPFPNTTLYLYPCPNKATVASLILDDFGHYWANYETTGHSWDSTTEAFIPFFDAHTLDV